ncbi:hypothetical protein E2493_10140 [Sphingomonas parva]|uniref:Uncharacterized protein n=1 Tax=Sphingomonas parva TaxID=2555898 RepID=A0A4Y8ZQP3_9SPHN|nr:hypothetical protein [Sphingomonas parva]TFI58338.1 hypothetical protein E2493_10140 [Sphingomonas parva]
MAQGVSRRPPSRFLLLVLAAALPLLLAVVLLQLIAPAAPQVGPADLAALAPVKVRPYLPGALAYAALILVHLLACATAITLAALTLRVGPRGRAFALTGLLMTLGLAIAILLLRATSDSGFAALRVSYGGIRDLLAASGAAGELVLPMAGPLTPLALSAYAATVAGIAAVSLTAAAAASQVWNLYGPQRLSEEDAEARLCLVNARIRRCAYALSLVLVTSTVSASHFFGLPARALARVNLDKPLIPPASPALLEATQARLAEMASELTFFWAAVYTLTLIAAVGIPLLLVQKQAHEFLEALRPPERALETRRRLSEAGALSGGGEQAKMLLAFVAPLLSAPVTNLLQAATG